MKKSILLTVLLSLTSPAYSGTSAENRVDKQGYVAGSVGALGIGVAAGLYLDSDTRIDAQLARHDYSFLGRRTESSEMKLEVQKFLSTTFYLSGGLTYQDIESSDRDYFFDLDATYDYDGTANLLGLHVSIGNEWQWESFSLGAEWFGLLQPLVTESSIKFAKEDPDSTYQPAREAEFENDVKEISPFGLNLFIGVSF